jgi:hypothetical protein
VRAARIVEPGRGTRERAAVPVSGPGQVRIRLEGSGVYGSNAATEAITDVARVIDRIYSGR